MAELIERYITTVNDKEFDLYLYKDGDKFLIKNGNRQFEVTFDSINSVKFLLHVDSDSSEVDIMTNNGTYDIYLEGQDIKAKVEPYNLAELRKRAGATSDGPADTTVKAPMPGLVMQSSVTPGDTVKRGDTLIIIEAMKMENMIKAPFDGKVKEIFVENGQAVDKNDKLIDLE